MSQKNVSYSVGWFHVQHLEGFHVPQSMSSILRAGFKCWHVKGLHVLAPGGLSCATMFPILRAGSQCWHVKGLHVLNKCPLSVQIYGVSVICRKPCSNNIEDGHLQGDDLKIKQAVVYLLSPIHHYCRCSLSLLLKYPSN